MPSAVHVLSDAEKRAAERVIGQPHLAPPLSLDPVVQHPAGLALDVRVLQHADVPARTAPGVAGLHDLVLIGGSRTGRCHRGDLDADQAPVPAPELEAERALRSMTLGVEDDLDDVVAPAHPARPASVTMTRAPGFTTLYRLGVGHRRRGGTRLVDDAPGEQDDREKRD